VGGTGCLINIAFRPWGRNAQISKSFAVSYRVSTDCVLFLAALRSIFETFVISSEASVAALKASASGLIFAFDSVTVLGIGSRQSGTILSSNQAPSSASAAVLSVFIASPKSSMSLSQVSAWQATRHLLYCIELAINSAAALFFSDKRLAIQLLLEYLKPAAT
jgi:hypothetical protein